MSDFFSKMVGSAQKAASKTGIDYRVILAQWYLETGGGTSALSQRANNYAGIKSSSQGKDFTSGRYAGYNSLDSFVTDYSRVMHLSYYDKVRSAVGIEAQVKALDDSPWAEDPNYDKKLLDVIKKNFSGSPPVNTGGGVKESGFSFDGIIDILKSPFVIGGLALFIILRG